MTSLVAAEALREERALRKRARSDYKEWCRERSAEIRKNSKRSRAQYLESNKPRKYSVQDMERCHRTTKYGRSAALLNKYGLTVGQFESLFAAQGGKCAVCRTANWGSQGPVVDHCHKTGKVRGILCNRCNLGLGHFLDQPDFLISAAEYLVEASKS